MLLCLFASENKQILALLWWTNVVVMDKHQYHEKVLSMLNDKQTYTALKSDPTGRTERDLNQQLLLLKKSNKISEQTYK